MQIKQADFVTSAKGVAGCPEWQLPEFAFIGRSNVGKSSLINMLTNRKDLAKVSSTPGKTRLLNFFKVNGNWSLVDLPGYGFAKVAKSEKFDFNELVGDYLEQREQLRRLFVLIDSRLKPQRIDLDFLAWAGGVGVPVSLVFTKADKQSVKKTRDSVALFYEMLEGLIEELPESFVSSSKARDGRKELLGAIGRDLE